MEKAKNPALTVYCMFLLCFLLRAIEYMLIRTDQSFIGEAFIHKAIGIIILVLSIRLVHYRWPDIGFRKQTAIKHTLFGLLLGVCAFIIAYGAEILASGGAKLAVYVSSFSLAGNNAMQANMLFFAVCIAGNIINVVMEEGVFRGLFVRLGEEKYSFIKSAFFSSLLFGLWHIAAPLRELCDGNMQVGEAIVAVIMQIFLGGIMGMELCLLVKITGSIWASMAVHFVNNFIVNILHVVTASGADELQVLRISIAQTFSFIVILLIYWKKKSGRYATYRGKS